MLEGPLLPNNGFHSDKAAFEESCAKHASDCMQYLHQSMEFYKHHPTMMREVSDQEPEDESVWTGDDRSDMDTCAAMGMRILDALHISPSSEEGLHCMDAISEMVFESLSLDDVLDEHD